VTFRPEALTRSAGRPAGLVDYRLARNAVVAEFRRGRQTRLDVCDAHPELLRAARSVGEATGEECPICSAAEVVHVSYVFGSRLPASGRCVTGDELHRYERRAQELACYVVEVCRECSWNHLARAFPVGGRGR
jgi:hypothetical protein